MSRLAVYSEAVGGGDRVYLDSLGPIRGLRFSTTINGDLGASWQAVLDPRLNHRALQSGRLISIPITPTQAWHGTLDLPQAGTVWQFTATGTAALFNRWSALSTTGTNNALALNEVVDQTIARGNPITRPASLPSLPAGQQQSGAIKLDEALTQVTSQLNQWWNVSRTFAVTVAALPTTLTYLLKAQDNAGGRTLDGFITDVTVIYLDATTYTLKTLQRTSAFGHGKGRFEDTLDVTGDGPLTAAQAQTRGDNYLATAAPRLKFAGAFVIARGQLLNAGGSPVDLATVQSGALTRVLLVDPDTTAGEPTLGPVQIVGGQTDYDVDADQLTYTPLDYSPQGLAALVTGGGPAGQEGLSYLTSPGMVTVSETQQITAAFTAGVQSVNVAVTFAKTYQTPPQVAPAVVSGAGAAAGATWLVFSKTTVGCTVQVRLAAAAAGSLSIPVDLIIAQN